MADQREWLEMLRRFPRVNPDDLRIFEGARITMKRMMVLEKGKILKAVTDAFNAGIIDYAEARSEAGYSTDDVESIIETWLEQKEMLGPMAGLGWRR